MASPLDAAIDIGLDLVNELQTVPADFCGTSRGSGEVSR